MRTHARARTHAHVQSFERAYERAEARSVETSKEFEERTTALTRELGEAKRNGLLMSIKLTTLESEVRPMLLRV